MKRTLKFILNLDMLSSQNPDFTFEMCVCVCVWVVVVSKHKLEFHDDDELQAISAISNIWPYVYAH